MSSEKLRESIGEVIAQALNTMVANDDFLVHDDEYVDIDCRVIADAVIQKFRIEQ